MIGALWFMYLANSTSSVICCVLYRDGQSRKNGNDSRNEGRVSRHWGADAACWDPRTLASATVKANSRRKAWGAAMVLGKTVKV